MPDVTHHKFKYFEKLHRLIENIYIQFPVEIIKIYHSEN